jgi:hypothetical protein
MEEFEELAAHLLGLEKEYEDDAIEDIDDLIWEKFGLGFEAFTKLVKALIPYTVAWESPITKTVYQGFVKDRVAIVKQEVRV